MKNVVMVCVAILVVVVYAFAPVSAGSDPQGTLIAQADTAAPAEPAKEEAKEEAKEPAKEEAKPAAAGDVPATIVFENCGKFGPVSFDHKVHGEKNACKDCHEGDKPLFEKKVTKTGWKMADMYTGQTCGACHDGKKSFEAKKGCMKCHKKK